MKKRQVINDRGEVIDFDGEIIPPGFGVRVSAFLMDGADQAIDHTVLVTDAFGNAAGNRPGFCYPVSPQSTTDARDAARDAREAYRIRLQDAWKTPTPIPVAVKPAHGLATDHPLRPRPPSPPPRSQAPHHPATTDTPRIPNPVRDAADLEEVREASYRQRVAALQDSWRTPTP